MNKDLRDTFFDKSNIQKSQSQSRTSGNETSNRRKTRVMSDDEDITMDETNHVCTNFLSLN